MPYATYRFNKIIAAETIRFIVTVAIVVYKVVYKGLKLVVYRMLTLYRGLTKVRIAGKRNIPCLQVIVHCWQGIVLWLCVI